RQAVPLVDESLLVRMLKNKLSHHAYLAVENDHVTVNKFLDTLKKIFGPSRSSNYYCEQLSIVYKKFGGFASPNSGNLPEASTNETNRGLGIASRFLAMQHEPGAFTSFEPTMRTYPSSSSSSHSLEDQQHSC
ncbi:hypothetical protein ALC56_02417, partial [Trachymyrmex septentrionalis]